MSKQSFGGKLQEQNANGCQKGTTDIRRGKGNQFTEIYASKSINIAVNCCAENTVHAGNTKFSNTFFQGSSDSKTVYTI